MLYVEHVIYNEKQRNYSFADLHSNVKAHDFNHGFLQFCVNLVLHILNSLCNVASKEFIHEFLKKFALVQ